MKQVASSPKWVLWFNFVMGKQQSKMKKGLIRRLAKETHFTEEELRLWHKGFFKDCPNGTLSRGSFMKIYQKFFPNGDSTKFANLVFRVFDENQDGFIEFEEFVRAISVTGRGSLDEKLVWAFKLYDLDSDGYITREEMLLILEAIELMLGNENEDEQSDSQKNKTNSAKKSTLEAPLCSSKDRIEAIFQKLDQNKDNRLSLEEFMQSTNDPNIIKSLYMNNMS